MQSWKSRQAEWIARLDSAVSEVFEMMLARNCLPTDSADAIIPCISARIGFSGVIDGECVLFASETVARMTAEALLGIPSGPGDPMAGDAFGELCNMIAGGWKSKLESEEATCAISPPRVLTHDIAIERAGHEGIRRFYNFDGHILGVQMNF